MINSNVTGKLRFLNEIHMVLGDGFFTMQVPH